MDEKQYISSIKLADGTIYEVKDSEARELLNSLFGEELIINCGGVPEDAE